MRSHELAAILLSAPDARVAFMPGITTVRDIATVSHGFFGCDDIIVIKAAITPFGYAEELRHLIKAETIPWIL